MNVVRGIFCCVSALYSVQTLQLGCYPGEQAGVLQACRMQECEGKGEQFGRSERRAEGGGRLSSGGGGEHCLRRERDERGCLCQSLIPPFGK